MGLRLIGVLWLGLLRISVGLRPWRYSVPAAAAMPGLVAALVVSAGGVARIRMAAVAVSPLGGGG